MSRAKQVLDARATINDLTSIGKDLKRISFKRLKTLLVNGFRVPSGVSSERYTAMVKSLVYGHTIDEDVIWHRG